MPINCIIKKDDRGRITRVETPTGQRSTLFDKLMGMAPVSDARKAAKAMMTVYGERFKERFGDWERRPVVRDDLRRLRFRLIGTTRRIGGDRRITFTRANPTTTFKALLERLEREGTEREVIRARTGSNYVRFERDGVSYDIRFSNHTKGRGWYDGLREDNGVSLSLDGNRIYDVSIDLSENGMGINDIYALMGEVVAFNGAGLDLSTSAERREVPSFMSDYPILSASMDEAMRATPEWHEADRRERELLDEYRGYVNDNVSFNFPYTTPNGVTLDENMRATYKGESAKAAKRNAAIEQYKRALSEARGEFARNNPFDAWVRANHPDDAWLLSGLRFRFIGMEGAYGLARELSERSYIFDDLILAGDMEDEGKDADAIYWATGWRRAGDGKWRYEMSDKGFKISPDVISVVKGLGPEQELVRLLEDVIPKDIYDEMVAMYPKAKNMRVVFKDEITGNPSAVGVYIRQGNQIQVSPKSSSMDRTLLHELQHFIQAEEGFSRGGNILEFDNLPEIKMMRDILSELEKEKNALYDSEPYVKAKKAFIDFLREYDPLERKKFSKDYSDMLRRMDDLDDEMSGLSRYYLANVFKPDISGDEADKLFRADKRIKEIVSEMDRLRSIDPSYERDMTKDELDRWDELDETYGLESSKITTKEEELEDKMDDYREAIVNIKYTHYRNLYGEAESRMTSDRMDMTDEERRSTPWWERGNGGLDIDPSDAIYIEQGKRVTFAGSVRNVSDSIGVTVDTVTSLDISRNVDDPALREAMLGSKGWYDPATDTITVVVDNIESEADAEATVLHEAIAHKGMRKLLGDRFVPTMEEVYRSMPEVDQTEYLSRYGDAATAAEEWLGTLSETYVEPSLLDRIVAIIRDALRAIGIDLKMNDADIANLLKRSKDNLSRIDDDLSKMEGMADERAGLLYPSGEPRLFYRSDGGSIKGSYQGAASSSPTGKVTAGFVSGRTTGDDPDVTMEGDDITIKNDGEFIPAMTVDATADVATRAGYVNYLVRKGLLSGERVYRDGEYLLTGAGSSGLTRLVNASNAVSMLKARFGGRSAQINAFGEISFDTEADTDAIETVGRDGSDVTISRSEAEEMIRQGRYNELDRRIEDAGEIAATMALDEARKRAVGAKPLDRRMRDEEASIRASLMDILSSLGVRVIGMKEYVDGYAARNGVPLSVRALADTANMVVALAEGATVEDLAEETAHFLIDTYRNQAEIDAILPSVRGTEEWSKYSGRYYHLYGRDYEGAELDRMVEREILGKILSRKFTRGMNTDLDAMERSNDGHISLLGRIIRAIRNFLTNQRDRLDRTLERVRDYALSGEMGVFDPSLVSVAQRVMYSADDVRYAKRLMKAKRGLERTFHNLRRMELSRTALLGETVRTLKETEAALSAAKDNEDAMNKHSVVSAMQSVISTAEAQVRYLINSAKALRRSDNLDFDILRAADEVYNGIVPLLKELIGLVNDSPSGYFPDGGSMLTRMRSAMATAENARADIDEARRRNMDGYLDRFFDKYNIEERHRKIIKELVGSVMRDVGYISRFFGTLEHSSNPILSMLGYMLSIVAQKARREAIRRVDPMLRLISEKKFTISDYRKLIKKRGDKYTMFLMAGRDVALYDLNMRRAEAEALIDIYSLERVHDNMTREDMINAIISDKGFETERIIRRPDVDENGEPKRDAEGNVVMKDVRLGQKVRLMANGRPMDYTVMEVTERTELDELMDRWHEENDERPYKEEYYEMVRRVEAEFRKSNDGKDMSPDTRAFLRRIRADRDAVYARFAKPDGSTDWEALSKDSLATSTLDDIATDRRWAKSEKNKDGSDKSDEERRLAEEISLWDRLWSKELGERGQGRLSREILSIVSSIQRERGPKAAMDFLLSGAKVGFKEEVWGESLAKRIENRWEEYSSKVNPGEKDIKMISDAREIAARLDDTRREIRAILSNYRTGSRYGEYDVTVIMNDPTVRLRLMDLYSGAETMRRKLLGIARYFDVQGLEMEGLESDTSQSYKDAYDDAKRLTPGLREHEFALRLMSPQRSKALRMLGEKLRRGNVTGLTPFEKRFLEKELGADYESVVAEIGKEAKDEVEFTDTIQDILDSYSRLLVPSYCKLSSPTGFSVFQDKMESGEIDVVRMLSDMKSGMTRESSIDVYGFDINTLRLDFNTRWLDNDKRLESMRNPDYDTSLGYGSRIPRKSKYTDKEYYSFFGIDEGNERMEATRNKDLWELRKTFLDIADQVMTDYNDRWRGIYMLPQLSKGMTERFHTSFGSVGNAVRNYLKDVAGERIDDPMYGQRVEGAADGARQVPKYYVYRLEDSDDVSHDLGYSYGMLALQGARYKEKSEALSDVMGQETLMRQAEFEGGKNPEATRAMRQMTDWIDAAIYDVRMNGDKIEWNVGGHRVNVAKLLSTITKVISSFNIGFSHVVALTGALTGNTNLMIEGALGSYVDKGSLKFGMAEARRQLPKFMSEVGELDRRNKLYVLGERAGLFNVSNRIRSTAYNKIWRTMFRDMPFKLMEILNTPLDLAIIGAVTKDIRLFKINEGKENERLVFGSFNEFKADRLANGKGTGATSVRDEWDSIADQSLYDLIDTSDGDIKATRPELQEMVDKYFDTAAVRMRSMSQVVGGYLNDDNRVSASRNMILNLVLQHRGWLILYAQRAYKRRGINHFTGEEEEGYINTYLNLLRGVFKTARDGRWSETLNVLSEEYHKLSDFEKRNIRRGAFDFGVLVAFNILSFALLGYMDDDDDDWLAQYATLVVSRYMNEMVGQGGVAMIPGMVDAFQEPFVIARKIGDIMNIPAWVGTVDSGVYKGYPAWVRQVMKLTWGKQLFNYMTPADIRQTYEYWYLMNKMTMGLASGWPKAMMSGN